MNPGFFNNHSDNTTNNNRTNRYHDGHFDNSKAISNKQLVIKIMHVAITTILIITRKKTNKIIY